MVKEMEARREERMGGQAEKGKEKRFLPFFLASVPTPASLRTATCSIGTFGPSKFPSHLTHDH